MLLLVKRLPWIFLGIAVGLSAALSPRLMAHERIAQNDVPPPITIKFIGVLELKTKKAAVFSNGTEQPFYAGVGETVLGQYKLLSINMGSVTMSCLDAKTALHVPMARAADSGF
jgi:hypothetical protein